MASVETARFAYKPVTGWPTLPEYWNLRETSDVAVDSRDRVWIFDRGAHPLVVFDRDGTFVTAWGEGLFRGPHGIHIGPDDSVYLVDRYAHVVMKFSARGELLLTLGERDRPRPTFPGHPFNMPTGVALSESGEIFVSDGYGNRRVHKYSREGKLLLSWGTPGDGPGQFALSHNIAVDRHGRVYVCDRENNRIQIFDADGHFIAEWSDCLLPQDLYITPEDLAYVAEKGTARVADGLGEVNMKDAVRDLNGAILEGMRITLRDLNGKILTSWNDNLERPHGIWVNSKGDVFVADLSARVHMYTSVRTT